MSISIKFNCSGNKVDVDGVFAVTEVVLFRKIK